MRHTLGCISHYEVRGAYARLGAAASPEVEEAIDSATRRVYFDDPLRISEPYSFFLESSWPFQALSCSTNQ
jgi:hypothetical protein